MTTQSTRSRFQPYVKPGQGWRSKDVPSIVIRVEEMTGQGSLRAVVAQHPDSHEVGADRHMTQSAIKANYIFEADEIPSPIAAPTPAPRSVFRAPHAARHRALAALALAATGHGRDLQVHLLNGEHSTWCGLAVLASEATYATVWPSPLSPYLCSACERASVGDQGESWRELRALVRLAVKITRASDSQLEAGWLLIDHGRRTIDTVTIVQAGELDVLVRYGKADPQDLARQSAAYGSRDFYADPSMLVLEKDVSTDGYSRRH